MKGIIMAGGMGSRLRPLTCNLPKPMVPIFNKPVVEYGARLLRHNDITDIGFTLFYLPEKIVEYFGDGDEFNINTNYYVEESPLGTGGSVKNTEGFLDSTIVVISGDALTDIDLKKAYEFHKKKGSKATLILKKETIPLEYGVVVTDENDRIIRFLEKPSWGEVFSDTVNTGIYILEPEVFDYYRVGENFDFSNDLFPRLLKDNVPMYGYIAEGYWSDVGDLKTYIQTHEDILGDKEKHHLLGETDTEGIWIGEGTVVEKNAKLNPPVFIGKDCIIEEGAVIDSYTVIGDNTKIGRGSSIKRSIIWNNTNISKSCEIRKAVICDHVYIGEYSRVFEGAVIGAYSKVFKESTVKPGVKIWPYKTVNEKTVVEHNLIWGEGLAKKLFGQRNISGIFNQNITPEIAAGIGIAFATVKDGKHSLLVSSDEKNLSKCLRKAIASGLHSTGAQVVDINDTTIPMSRFAVRRFNLDGGIHIRCDDSDEDKVYLEFFDETGANIDKGIAKKVEKSLAFEDYNRCIGKEVRDDVVVENFYHIYLSEGVSRLENLEKIRKSKLKVLFYSPSKRISEFASEYLNSLGCEVDLVDEKEKLSIEELKDLVLERSKDIGILDRDGGEKIQLTDGYSVIRDEKYYMLSVVIGLRQENIKDIVVPYHYPRIIEKIVKEAKKDTIYSDSSDSSIIEAVLSEQLDYQYLLNFDGIWAIGMILDYLVETDSTISEVLEKLPEYYYMKKEIPCDWTDKGNIIRRLSQDKESRLELIEGVRVLENGGWVLVIPDEEKPVLNVYIEGTSQVEVEELWDKHNEKLLNMFKEL